MQMVGLLASGIAHNFNNIVAAILGYSEMIQPQMARGSKPARYVDEIRRAAMRGRDLVDNILTFGRRTDKRLQSVQVRCLLEETASLLQVTLPGCRSGRERCRSTSLSRAGDITTAGYPQSAPMPYRQWKAGVVFASPQGTVWTSIDEREL
jgi:signal transduction histidine kinase